MRKVAILGSTSGFGFESIIKYFKKKSHKVEFTCISDVENSEILNKAKSFWVNCHYLSVEETEKFLNENHFDLVVLTDYTNVLPVEIFKHRVFINIHQSLLPKYKGSNAVKQAFDNHEKLTGVTVYAVVNNIEEGPVIAQQAVSISENITVEELETKIRKIECGLYPKVIEDILFSKKSGCSSGCSCGSRNKCHCE